MPRKITTEEWKNRRDYNAWKIKLDEYTMSDTHAKYEEAVKVIAQREEDRITKLKDTLWEAAVTYFGINITPEELKAAFEKIMNAKCNENAVLDLMSKEEERKKTLQAEDEKRIATLKAKHTKLIKSLEEEKNRSEDSPASDSKDLTDEAPPTSKVDKVK